MGYKIKKIKLGTQQIRPDKMPGYQEVEYIEGGASGCAIDTGLSLGSSLFKIESDVMQTQTTSIEQAIFSIWTSYYNYWNCFIRLYSSVSYFDCYTAGHHMTSSISNNTKYNVVLERTSASNWSLSKDGTATTWTYSPGEVNNTKIKLFRRGDGDAPSSLIGKIRMYYCKITVGGTLLRDFIPCYRKSDGVIGLYDMVNKQFYINEGSGTFTKGPDVN